MKFIENEYILKKKTVKQIDNAKYMANSSYDYNILIIPYLYYLYRTYVNDEICDKFITAKLIPLLKFGYDTFKEIIETHFVQK